MSADTRRWAYTIVFNNDTNGLCGTGAGDAFILYEVRWSFFDRYRTHVGYVCDSYFRFHVIRLFGLNRRPSFLFGVFPSRTFCRRRGGKRKRVFERNDKTREPITHACGKNRIPVGGGEGKFGRLLIGETAYTFAPFSGRTTAVRVIVTMSVARRQFSVRKNILFGVSDAARKKYTRHRTTDDAGRDCCARGVGTSITLRGNGPETACRSENKRQFNAVRCRQEQARHKEERGRQTGQIASGPHIEECPRVHKRNFFCFSNEK